MSHTRNGTGPNGRGRIDFLLTRQSSSVSLRHQLRLAQKPQHRIVHGGSPLWSLCVLPTGASTTPDGRPFDRRVLMSDAQCRERAVISLLTHVSSPVTLLLWLIYPPQPSSTRWRQKYQLHHAGNASVNGSSLPRPRLLSK